MLFHTHLQVWQASNTMLMVRAAGKGAEPTTLVLRASNDASVAVLQELHELAAAQRRQDAAQPPADGSRQDAANGHAAAGQPAGGGQGGGSHFDAKTDKGSAELYFHYYGCLQHQQNMLQDYIRTGGQLAGAAFAARALAGGQQLRGLAGWGGPHSVRHRT
jgi:histone-arginine methyltransferase CARM1